MMIEARTLRTRGGISSMKKIMGIASVLFLAFLPAFPAAAQQSGLSAVDILNKVDDVVNAPKDQTYSLKIVLIDKSGTEKTQELLMLQKGRDKRLAKVLSPADQKGIAFLSLPDGVQYLYLPAFGKAQRLDSLLKNTSFSGTDFSYEDMEAGRESDRWDPTIVKQDQDTIVLEMKPKPGKTSDYSKLIMWVRSNSFVPTRVEHYDKNGKLYKVLVRDNIQLVGGYWIAMEMTMEDLKKQHKTKMITSDMQFDTGLPDSRFTELAMTK
jgi:outer membrane lipoprotein-sorting protein